MKYINPSKQDIGSFIPEWLEGRTEISPGAKLVYARLRRFAGRDGLAYPKIETLSEAVGCPLRTVKRYLQELKDLGLIHTIRRGLSKSNVYKFPVHEWMGLFNVEQEDVEIYEDSMKCNIGTSDEPDLHSSSAKLASPKVRESLEENHLNTPLAPLKGSAKENENSHKKIKIAYLEKDRVEVPKKKRPTLKSNYYTEIKKRVASEFVSQDEKDYINAYESEQKEILNNMRGGNGN